MKKKGIIALLAILALVLGIFAYLFSTNTLVSPIKYEKELAKVEQMSDSDDISDIEKDLEETDLDNLDSELSDIETELSI